MRLVIDTNILVSALLAATSLPAQLVVLWRAGRFDLLTAAEQLDEFMRVTRYPKIRERLAPAIAGRLVNDLRALAFMVDKLPVVDASPDPGRQLPAGPRRGGRGRFSGHWRQARPARHRGL